MGERGEGVGGEDRMVEGNGVAVRSTYLGLGLFTQEDQPRLFRIDMVWGQGRGCHGGLGCVKFHSCPFFSNRVASLVGESHFQEVTHKRKYSLAVSFFSVRVDPNETEYGKVAALEKCTVHSTVKTGGCDFLLIRQIVSSRYFKVEVHLKLLISQSKFSGPTKNQKIYFGISVV